MTPYKWKSMAFKQTIIVIKITNSDLFAVLILHEQICFSKTRGKQFATPRWGSGKIPTGTGLEKYQRVELELLENASRKDQRFPNAV